MVSNDVLDTREATTLLGSKGRYELAEELGAGGTATVHRARCVAGPGGARTVAIKRLHPHLAKDAAFRSMLIDEARLAARIHHPNVCAVLDVIDEGGALALVLDYVDGASLSALTKQPPHAVPAEIAVAIACGTLEGLEAAHTSTDHEGRPLLLVHRDVSPQNILVGIDGRARITDFGTAKAFGRVTETAEGLIKGKIAYMAPEQISGLDVDRRADVYAAAVVLWELLTGHRLFEGNGPSTMLDVLEQSLKSPTEAGVTCDPNLDRVVMRGLDRDRDARFATAHEMAVALRAVITPSPPSAVAAWLRAIRGDTGSATRYRSPDSAPGSETVHSPPSERRPSTSMLVARPSPSRIAFSSASAPGFQASSVELVACDRDQTLVIYGPLLVQIRNGGPDRRGPQPHRRHLPPGASQAHGQSGPPRPRRQGRDDHDRRGPDTPAPAVRRGLDHPADALLHPPLHRWDHRTVAPCGNAHVHARQ